MGRGMLVGDVLFALVVMRVDEVRTGRSVRHDVVWEERVGHRGTVSRQEIDLTC